MKGLFERIEGQLGAKRVRHPPAHDAPRVGVDDEGGVGEPSPRGHVSQVRHPQRIGAAHREDPVDPVGRALGGGHRYINRLHPKIGEIGANPPSISERSGKDGLAKPTARARHKKASRRTDDGAPLHSLDTLLGELATRCRNTCRVPADPSAPPLSLLTEPTSTRRPATSLIASFQYRKPPKAEKSKPEQTIEPCLARRTSGYRGGARSRRGPRGGVQPRLRVLLRSRIVGARRTPGERKSLFTRAEIRRNSRRVADARALSRWQTFARHRWSMARTMSATHPTRRQGHVWRRWRRRRRRLRGRL